MPYNFSENFIKNSLTLQNYNKWLSENGFTKKEENEDWNKKTASCGAHSWWVLEQLNIPTKDFANYQLVTIKNIPNILNLLDKGHLIKFYHNYKNPMILTNLRKNNRYGNHEFAIVKGGDKYFVTQGYLNGYKHSLISYNNSEIYEMLQNIINKLSDYDNNKTWSDIDLSLHKKYFRTDLFLYPKLPILQNGKMHNIVLKFDIY